MLTPLVVKATGLAIRATARKVKEKQAAAHENFVAARDAAMQMRLRPGVPAKGDPFADLRTEAAKTKAFQELVAAEANADNLAENSLKWDRRSQDSIRKGMGFYWLGKLEGIAWAIAGTALLQQFPETFGVVAKSFALFYSGMMMQPME